MPATPQNETSYRPARQADAPAMTDVQNELFRRGLRESPTDLATILDRYFDAQHGVVCTVAERDGVVIGFQSLKRAWPGNPYGVTEGWGVIGTHIHPDAGRSGIGRRLFAYSFAAAQEAGIRHIDATIGADNAPGLAYYRAMGFAPYGESGDAIPHRLDVPPQRK